MNTKILFIAFTLIITASAAVFVYYSDVDILSGTLEKMAMPEVQSGDVSPEIAVSENAAVNPPDVSTATDTVEVFILRDDGSVAEEFSLAMRWVIILLSLMVTVTLVAVVAVTTSFCLYRRKELLPKDQQQIATRTADHSSMIGSEQRPDEKQRQDDRNASAHGLDQRPDKKQCQDD
jgi:flagellar basal body-associated protein FliL